MRIIKFVGKRILSKIVSLAVAASCYFGMISYMAVAQDATAAQDGAVNAAVTLQNSELSDDIVVLYTNDVHTYIDGELSYDNIAAIKKELEKMYKYVVLVDAGDHIQGTAYGAMDKGKTISEMMNAAGYDAATLGNHEFDYGMQGCLDAIKRADFPYLSCNFYHENNGVRGENVLDSYKLFELGGDTVAFVGITTPETFSKSTPAYFQNSDGDFIYNISGGDDGKELANDIQEAINSARENGATKVIALGHLGVDPSSKPWTSEEIIALTSGLDAFIDGHSHTIMKCENVANKEGKNVILTQTGEYFNRIGVMIISAETGEISTDFIEYNEDGSLSSSVYNSNSLPSATDVKLIKDNWISQIDQSLGQKIGETQIVFDNYDSNGNRIVRAMETNTGDFSADALYYLFDEMNLDVNVAVMNGGGIRNSAITGEITYKTCKDIHPFGNVACLLKVSGQQILDMLEWGARFVNEAENGGFMQVSGLTYKIDTSVENTVKVGKNDAWAAAPEKYRVYDVRIYNKTNDAWEDINFSSYYNLAGYNYTLRNLGDGFTMFDDAENIVDYVMEDYMVLANYVSAFENGVIAADNSPLLKKYPSMLLDYENGSGRIVNEKQKYESIQNNDNNNPETGDSLLVQEVVVMGITAGIVLAAMRKRNLNS